jgi:prepilin-type N-terminal cleavage/methylation domain-containing protein
MIKLVRLNRGMRKAFTLPEILVSITLVAILAAVVVPTITSQIKKGDPSRVGNDFLAVRGGVEQFLTDVRRYPGSISQLMSTITTGQNPLAGTAISAYGTAETARWRGPYMQKDPTVSGGTGFGLQMAASFDTVSLGTSGAASASGQKYMVIAIPFVGNDSLSALEVDKQFDDGVLLTGNIRYRKHTATESDTLKYLLMPVY